MARAQGTDFYHNMKFHAKVVSTGVDGAADIGAAAGFTTVTIPEMTTESVEYKEGVYLYRRKFPGDVAFSDMTLTRGVAKGSTQFYRWIRSCFLGKEYRADLEIRQFHRDETTDATDYTAVAPARTFKVYEAFAIRVKPTSDFDGQSSDVALEEIDIALEYFELTDAASA